MPLIIDSYSIPDKYLIGFIPDADQIIRFQGRALEGIGKAICERLDKYRKGEKIEVVVNSRSTGFYREGIYKIVEIQTQPPAHPEKAQAIYRFSGILEPVP